MKQKTYFISFIAIVFTVLNNFAQPGSIDPTFNPMDSGFWKENSLNRPLTASSVQKDGKTIIAGYFTLFNDTKVNRIARLNPDGTLDGTFKNQGTGPNSQVDRILEQTDGKILIAGMFRTYNAIQRNSIARLNADGSLDTTFDPGTGIPSNSITPISMVLQTDGKIIIAGAFTSYDGKNVNHIARLHPNGTLDTTFHTGTGTDGSIDCMILQKDGKIVIGGFFTRYNDQYSNYIARINTDGSFDPTFQIGTGPDGAVDGMVSQTDGKIIITGAFRSYNNSSRNLIARLNEDGSLDHSFVVPSGTFAGSFASISMQPDGKIIVVEYFYKPVDDSSSHIVRLNSDGTPDNDFNKEVEVNSTIYGLSVQNNGKIVIGGYFTKCNKTLRNYIACLNSDGTLDKTMFSLSGKGTNGIIWCSAIQNDGKILIGGEFSAHNGIESRGIARLNTDGTTDTSFHVRKGANDWVEHIALQNDGKILLAGWFRSYDSLPYKALVRLNKNGSLDTTFKSTFNNTSLLETVFQQADGMIIIGGNFTSYNGVKVNNIARLFPNGAIDTTFKASKDMDGNATVWRTINQPDGKIIVTGYFEYTGTIANHIVRLNSDGSLDPTFNPGIGADNIIYTATLQQDGKMIIIGDFKTFNGKTANQICRLNIDGSLDSTFNSGTGTGNSIYTSAIQKNGKVIIGGTFEKYNGVGASRICRLNIDGSLDNSFQSGSGADYPVYTTTIQSDGKILIGGFFTSYNGTGRNCIARILGDNPVNVQEESREYAILLYPNPSNGQFTVQSDKPVKISIFDNWGRSVLEQQLRSGKETVNMTNVNNGIYFLRIIGEEKHTTQKIVIRK